MGDPAGHVMAWLTRRLTRLLDASHCHIVEQLPGSGDLILRASAGYQLGEAGKTIIPLASDPAAAAALRAARSVVADFVEGAAGPLEQQRDLAPAVPLRVSVPIGTAEQIYGVLTVVSARRRSFARGDLQFLEAVAVLLTGLTAQRLRQLEIESIVDLSRTLRRAATRAEMPSIILAHVRALMTCAGGAILLSRSGGEIVVALGDGIWAKTTGQTLDEAAGVSGEVIRSGVPFLSYAPARSVDFAPGIPLESGLAVACIPLMFGGGAIGTLWVACPAAIAHDDLHLLSNIADITANALYRADLSEQTTRLFREHQLLSEELRRAERHLASIVESASDLVISADVGGRIVTWNRAAERVSGYAKEQAIGRRLSDYCAPGDQTLMDSLLRQFFSGPHQGQIDEMCLVSSSGQSIPISWRFSPLQNDLGEVNGIVAVGRDLLEQRRLESQLFQAAKMASMGVMASGIGHEVRNPLGIISASAQLAQAHPDDPELVNTCLGRIITATKRAALIIDNLLTFAQPGGEERRPVDVNEVLAATLGLLEYQFKQRKIDFSTNLAIQLAPVLGNPALLQQVFTNLILNGCQAMPGGGALRVSTGLGEQGSVEVAVRDEGVGISEEVLPHIFEPFFTTRPVGQGTGLGLAISYSIVQQHGGEIEVCSRQGAGSTFLVRLPAVAPPAMAAER